MRNLIVVLGDQLNRDSAAFDGFDPEQDAIWMAEVTGESTHVPSHKERTAVFLTAMRHFRDARRAEGFTVHYRELESGTLDGHLAADQRKLRPRATLCVQPGEYRLQEALRPLVTRFLPDRHFLSTPEEFAMHARGRKQLRLEYFYREMRRRYGVLIDDGEPTGGAWNFDTENRGSFPRSGPPLFRRQAADLVQIAPADPLRRKVERAIEANLPHNPGQLGAVPWPATPAEAERALATFIERYLPTFGLYQDAMWTGEPFLFHSLLSSSLNLKLLDPRQVIRAAEEAFRAGHAPLAAVEGFIRQILGWREYVRGIYWLYMPEYATRNALDAHEPLPEFFWTGETEMTCLRETIRQTLEYGYAHHIQRLMVTGLFALLYGVEPRAIHEWYLAVYVDAVEWVELPNTIGMSQFADGGVMASKPYAATGKYIERMSNYCRSCRFDPAESIGEQACPFTTLYWDFLLRHEEKLTQVGRMDLQLRNLNRLPADRRSAIHAQAAAVRQGALRASR